MDVLPAANTGGHADTEMEMAIDAQARKPSISSAIEKPTIKERVWGLAARVDSTVTFEEYTFWAKIEREMEHEEEIKFKAEHGNFPLIDFLKSKLSSEGRARQKQEKHERQLAIEASARGISAQILAADEKGGALSTSGTPSEVDSDPLKVTDAEWRQASRAMRTASWGQMFFLITTDILGWSGAP